MKLKNSQLLLIFAAMLVIVFVIRLLNNKKEKGTIINSFFEIDTAQINKFQISPMTKANEGFILVRKDNVWMIEQSGLESLRVSDEAISQALGEFTKLQPSRLAAKDEESWSKYEVDTAGTLLEIFTKDKSYSIVIGKMIFQNKTLVNSYVRLADEKEVYACECYLEGTFKNPISKWRSKQNIRIPMGFWNTVNISESNGSALSLSRNESGWILQNNTQFENDMPIMKAIDGFNQLAFLTPTNGLKADSLLYSIEIIGESKSKTHLDLYRNGFEMNLVSDKNTGNYFRIDSSTTATLIQEVSAIQKANYLIP